MFEYLEIENLKNYLLICIPILAIFFIRFLESLKHSNEKFILNIFINLVPKVIISYIVSCLSLTLIYGIISIFFIILENFIYISNSLLETTDIIILIFSGTISSYILIKEENTHLFFRHKVNDETWMTASEERILRKKLKKINKKDYDKIDMVKRTIISKRNPEDEYYFWDKKRCIKMDKYKWAKVKEKYEFESEFYIDDIKYF